MQESNPYIYGIDEDMLPQIKDWEVGGEYQVTMTIRQIAKRVERDVAEKEESKKDKSPTDTISDFEVLSIKPIGTQSQMEKFRRKYGKS